MNKLIALLFWVALLVYGTWEIARRQSKPPSSIVAAPVGSCLTALQKKTMPHLLAQHDMVVNWRISISDLHPGDGASVPAIPDFAGKYVVCKVSAGEAVVSSEVTRNPEVSVPAGKALYLLALRAGQEESLNVGKHIDLFAGKTATISSAEIMAVICDSGCDAVLQLGPAEVELLKLSGPLELKWIMRNSP